MAMDVAISGTFAYVADGARGGLCIVDISDVGDLQVVGSLNTPGEARRLSAAGTWVYVADGPFGVQAIDVSDPRRPRQDGAAPSGIGAHSIALWGRDRAVVLDRVVGLHVLDVSDPRRLAILSSVPLSGTGEDLAVAVVRAFVLVRDVTDLSDRQVVVDLGGSPPTIESNDWLATFGDASDPVPTMGLLGTTLVTLMQSQGMTQLDAIDSRHPSRQPVSGGAHVGALPVAPGPIVMDDAGRFAGSKLADGPTIWAFPWENGRLPRPPAEVLLAGMRPAITMDHLLVPWHARGIGGGDTVGDTVFSVFRLGGPDGPVQVGDTPISPGLSEIHDVLVSKGHLLMSAARGSEPTLTVVRAVEPARPALIGDLSLPVLSPSLAITGDLLLAAGAGHLTLIDVSVPGRPTVLARYSVPMLSATVDVAATGRLVALTRGDVGVVLVDATNPLAAAELAHIPLPAERVAFDGDRLYVAAANSLWGIDTSEPRSPRTIGMWELDVPVNDMAIRGGQLAVSTSGQGLLFFAAPAEQVLPSPTSTAMPPPATDSPTPTTTPTLTPSPTPTAVPVITATPPRLPLYLPWIIRTGLSSAGEPTSWPK
jgi:hypothetical protein